jgi:two-component system nitrate/nitrite response regulator NarL
MICYKNGNNLLGTEDHLRGLSILLVEDSPLFREALTSALLRTGASVIACGLVSLKDKDCREYDVALVDIATFCGDDGRLAELIQGFLKVAPVLLLAREDRMDQIITCLKAGATGLVRQTASNRNLRDAIHALANGYAWFDVQVFRRVARCLVPVSQWREPRLTTREEEVLRCITQGQGNKEIAASLALSEQTVKVYVSNLLRKLGVPNRGLLASRAMARGTEAA